MKSNTLTGNINQSLVCPWIGSKALVFQLVLIASAVLLPAAAHLLGAPVRWLLPMHWPILLAGLVYGWRSGLVIGFLSPIVNWLLTGYPLPIVLPSMVIELMIYGFAAGWLREIAGWNKYIAIGTALVVGRIFFLISVLFTAGYAEPFGAYIIVAMTPGLIAGFAQVATLPTLSEIWFRKSRT